MNKRALSQVNGFGALIAIVLVVICGLRYLTGAGAFIFGAIFLAFSVWALSRIWNPLPRSFWWFCILMTCLGGIGLLLFKSATA